LRRSLYEQQIQIMSVLEWLLTFYTKILVEIFFLLVNFYVSKKNVNNPVNQKFKNKRVLKLGRGGVVW